MGIGDIDPADPTSPTYPKESAVEALVVDYFHNQGFDEIHTFSNLIPDLFAFKFDEGRWGVEVKGVSQNPKERVYTAIGQVVYSMGIKDTRGDGLHWAIAFPSSIPRETQYRELIQNHVSREILELLSIHVMFVHEDGDVDIFSPGEIGKSE